MLNYSLFDVREKTYFPLNLECGPETRRQYRIALTDWGRVLGHSPNKDDLTDDAVLMWARNMLDRRPKMSKWTINERTGRIRSLWNWLARRGMIPTFPTFKRIPVPEPTPRAWMKDELGRLFDAAQVETGTICGIPAGSWWRARVAFHWFTGERKGAVDSLRMEWVVLDSQFPTARIPAEYRKGGKKNGTYQLSPPLVAALRSIWSPARELVFPQDAPTMYWRRWNRILKRAELPIGRKSKTQALRISHASWVDHEGGDATKSLMHSDSGTTRKFYLDSRLSEPLADLFDPTLRPAG